MPSTVTQDNIILTLIEVICQTIMYGVFIVVMPILLHTLTTRKTRGPNSIMLWCTLCTFALASAHWAASVAALVAKISGSHEHRNSVIRTMFNAVVFLNFIFADTVVVWRMRVLCTSYIPSKVLLIPVMLLVITSFSVCAVVGLRIVITASPGNEARGGPLVEAINIAQTSGISFSLLSNIVATSIIGVWAWWIQKLFRTESADTGKGARITRAQRVVILLLESGSLYCISSILLLVSTLIRLPVGGTLGDIYTPVHVQISVSPVLHGIAISTAFLVLICLFREYFRHW
ncbi:hypothetical protein BDW22DRAFT_1462713 [Trametopsis cervina]|nr:hypothetical protein BDW22DRAFT_1462713 [Trametopsis cervina]